MFGHLTTCHCAALDAKRELLQRSEREFLGVLIHAAKHLRQERRDGFGLDWTAACRW